MQAAAANRNAVISVGEAERWRGRSPQEASSLASRSGSAGSPAQEPSSLALLLALLWRTTIMLQHDGRMVVSRARARPIDSLIGHSMRPLLATQSG